MLDITPLGYWLLLKNAFVYYSIWYVGYWLLPLIVLVLLLLAQRNKKVAGWQHLGRVWASIGWIMLGTVSLLYMATILAVPAQSGLFKVDGRRNMEQCYQARLDSTSQSQLGGGPDALSEDPRYCRNSTAGGREIFFWFYNHYRWTHSLLPWLIWGFLLLFGFVLPGTAKSREKLSFSKN